MILQTGVGIECGFDESAYLYSWTDEGWRRVWQTEQNTYTEREYKPQTIEAVLVSSYSQTNDYVLLTLGWQSWCLSGWHDVYYRAFRLGPDPSAAPLVDGDEYAYIAVDPPIQGSITRDDILIEFTVHSIDGGVLIRKAIRHYKIERDGVKRTDPLALTPRDFVDEWLTNNWRAAALWSEAPGRVNARDWHKKLHQDSVAGEFIYPTMHCADTPDVWQVGVDFSHPPTPSDETPKGTYFLVRWRPPYQFTMVEVSDHPSQNCLEEDRELDDESHTLFPIQDK